MVCPVCLGTGLRLELECGWCRGLGVDRKLSKEELVGFIEKQATSQGFKIEMVDAPKVHTNGVECSAFFCYQTRSLTVAKHSVNFFENLVHEFCHLRQFSHGRPAWKNSLVDGEDACVVVDDFLNGLMTDRARLARAIDKTIELEWDCEQMAHSYLSMVDGYTDDQLKTQQINAFIYMRFYRAVQEFGRWYEPGKDFHVMGIHHEYAEKIETLPSYNAPILQEEIDVFKKCFE